MTISLKYLNLIISILISSLLIFISTDNLLWSNFWNFLGIPYQLPPFSDLDSINRSLLSYMEGFNPYLENPNDISGSKYIYPKIWLYIFNFLNLNNEINFRLFCFIIIFSYFFSILNLFTKFKNKLFLVIILFFIFSKINLLLIERLNIDIIIFLLSCIILFSSKIFIKFFFFLLSFLLKIYPIFSILIFIKNKKYFYLALLFSFVSIILLKDQIILIKSNMIPYAMLIAYGFETLARGLYHYSINYNLFINNENYILFKNIIIFFGGIFTLSIFLVNFKFGNKIVNSKLLLDESLFLLGGGVYLGTFLIATNIDFRLIFLLFTFPLLMKLNKNIYIYLYIIFYIICLNALIIETGDRYSILYVLKSIMIHSMKLYIYTLVVYYLSSIINKNLIIKLPFFKT